MFYIQIIIRCYFAFLSIHSIFFEIFVSKIYISSIELLLLNKVYGIRFRSEIICKANSGHRSFERSHLAVRN